MEEICIYFLFVWFLNAINFGGIWVYKYHQHSSTFLYPMFFLPQLWWNLCVCVRGGVYFFGFWEKGKEEFFHSSGNTHIQRVSLFLGPWLNYRNFPISVWATWKERVTGAQSVTPECHLPCNNPTHKFFSNWNFAFVPVLVHRQLQMVGVRDLFQSQNWFSTS